MKEEFLTSISLREKLQDEPQRSEIENWTEEGEPKREQPPATDAEIDTKFIKQDWVASQQEWTPELEKLVSEALDNAITALGQCQKGTARQFLRSAINAALAAERDERALIEKDLQDALKDAADEREKYERLRGAIAEHNRKWDDNSTRYAQTDVDLSTLDKHDAELRNEVATEVRKPLVDALEAQAKLTAYYNGKGGDYTNWRTYLCEEAADALAAVKGEAK